MGARRDGENRFGDRMDACAVSLDPVERPAEASVSNWRLFISRGSTRLANASSEAKAPPASRSTTSFSIAPSPTDLSAPRA